MKPKALLSWSSGKDSAWALHVLREHGDVEVVGLVTTFNEAFDRVAMHGVRRTLVEAQARAAELPLWPVLLPWPCSNPEYEQRMRAVVDQAVMKGISHFAFGDLHLEDIRRYREQQLSGTGIDPIFPIWTTSSRTSDLANQMIQEGLQAVLTCVDPRKLSPEFVGREFDVQLLAELPASVDACGEQGEFHTFCFAGPMFSTPIQVAVGETLERDGFWFADLLPKFETDGKSLNKRIASRLDEHQNSKAAGSVGQTIERSQHPSGKIPN